MADPDLVLENLHIGKCFQYNTSEVYKTYNRAFPGTLQVTHGIPSGRMTGMLALQEVKHGLVRRDKTFS